jgi:phage baseplate assembly protein W
MSAPLYQTLRFLHPDVDAPAPVAGLQITPRGQLALADGNAAVRQALLILLSTAPGERVMLPDYGCDLGQLLFAPNDATTAGLAMHYVRRAIERWEPRVEIVGLDATRNPLIAARLDILLTYRVRATQRVEEVQLGLDLAGAG